MTAAKSRRIATTTIRTTTTTAAAAAAANITTTTTKSNTPTSLVMPTAAALACGRTDYCAEALTARSRRRRRLATPTVGVAATAATMTATGTGTVIPVGTPTANNVAALTTATTTTTQIAAQPGSITKSGSTNNASASSSFSASSIYSASIGGADVSPIAQLLSHVTQSLTKSTAATAAYVALLLLSTTCSLCAASPCESNSWWDPARDKCIPCTVCQGEMIPLRPCQLHRDTICGSIYDLKIDWVVLAKTEPNWKERRKSDDGEYNLDQLQQQQQLQLQQQQLQHLTHEQLQQLHEEAIPLDWQTAALFLAVLACLLFFIVAACILIHHMRQWRRMERRLDQDVEELSTKLMAKLAEVQSLEGGTFFIGNADALRVPTTTFQPQHVLLPDKPAKHHDRRILKTLQPGNVYIEENGSKG